MLCKFAHIYTHVMYICTYLYICYVYLLICVYLYIFYVYLLIFFRFHGSQHLVRHLVLQGTPLDAHRKMSMSHFKIRKTYGTRGELCPKPFENLMNWGILWIPQMHICAYLICIYTYLYIIHVYLYIFIHI